MPVSKLIEHSPDVLGDTPVFVGTRVPVRTLIDYIEGGHSLEDFLDDFPTINRDQAIGILEMMRNAIHFDH